MAKFKIDIENSKDIFLENLQKDMAKVSEQNPTLEAFIMNELGLSTISDEDFLSPETKSTENMIFDRVRGNPCLQRRQVLTHADENDIFTEAYKYKL